MSFENFRGNRRKASSRGEGGGGGGGEVFAVLGTGVGTMLAVCCRPEVGFVNILRGHPTRPCVGLALAASDVRCAPSRWSTTHLYPAQDAKELLLVYDNEV